MGGDMILFHGNGIIEEMRIAMIKNVLQGEYARKILKLANMYFLFVTVPLIL